MNYWNVLKPRAVYNKIKSIQRNRHTRKDVVVVSFPKSGRTWLRVMLDRLGVHLTYTHDHSGYLEKIPASDLSSDKSEFSNKKIILLVRDPRDTAVSGYFQCTKRHFLFDGSMSAFLRDPIFGIEKILRFQSLWEHESNKLPSFMVVRYEDLHTSPLVQLQRILQFVGEKKRESTIQSVIEFAQFQNMQKLEKKGYFRALYSNKLVPKNTQDVESYKVRKGKTGGFYEYFSKEDIAYCHELLKTQHNPYYAFFDVNPGEKYKHYKGGTYEIVDVAKHTETGQKMIVYRSLCEHHDLTKEYGARPLFVRPYDLFFEKVEYEGKVINRFQKTDA